MSGRSSELLELRRARPIAPCRRDLRLRPRELPAQLLVLGLQLVGPPEAVEEVGDRLDRVVGEVLERRDHVLRRGAGELTTPEPLLVEGDQRQRRDDEQHERDPTTAVLPIDNHGARRPDGGGQSWGEALRTCFSTSKFSRH